MPNLLITLPQPFLEWSPYFKQIISMGTKGPIAPAAEGGSYIHVIIDAFSRFIVSQPSPRNDAANALKVLFDHCIGRFGIQDNGVTDNVIEKGKG